ncbi:MAG: ferric reductase-like transmembrane domain-containing protein [Yoonia sp.]
MTRLSSFFERTSPYFLWLILSLPGLGIVINALGADGTRVYHQLLHPTGEFAARMMLISMIATPLAMWSKGWRGPRWLVKNRRYFGVAAFCYAFLHTLFYVLSEPMRRILAEATDLDIWTGWVAFAIFIPLAATSFDYAVRKMGTKWKSLQRWVYAAAILTFVHWATLHGMRNPWPAIVEFTPLVLLTLYRLWWLYLRKRPDRPTAA